MPKRKQREEPAEPLPERRRSQRQEERRLRQEGTERSQEGTERSQEGTARSQEGTARSQEGTERSQEGTERSQEGTERSQEAGQVVHYVPPDILRALQMWAEHNEVQHRRRAGVVMFLQEQAQAAAARTPRSCWVKPWLSQEMKVQKGAFHQLMSELQLQDRDAFVRFLRIEPDMFEEILEKIGDRIQHYITNYRPTLTPAHRLAICLRFLATGDTFRSLSFLFRVAHNTIARIVDEVCHAIIEEYHEEVMPADLSVDDWRMIADKFEQRWNFPHIVGAVDGKHVAIVKPNRSGSLFFNYKRFFSIVLMAVVDADYKFIYVDIGRNGAASDTQVWDRSSFKLHVEAGDANWPAPDSLPNDDGPTPYFLVGDDAFPLKTWMMKPYARRNLSKEERVFNYRLSRARRVVENAFGILVNRFRCLLKTLEINPEKATTVTLCCCMLHNLMRKRYPSLDQGQGDNVNSRGQIVPGAWRHRLGLVAGQENLRGNHGNTEAKAQRDYLKEYFNSEAGAVAWQNQVV